MAGIPGGTYTLGDRKDTATVAPFCLDKLGVTSEAFAACVSSGACTGDHLNEWSECNYKVSGREKHPMNCVDWGQAATYCNAQGKRLPTEEEREWAARGGSRGTTYPWGNEAPDFQLCWSGVSKRSGTCPVGSFPTGNNPQGVSDLAGNVWEWTSSMFDASGAARVSRGGCWLGDIPSGVRAANRNMHAPSNRNNYVGFRCARAGSP